MAHSIGRALFASRHRRSQCLRWVSRTALWRRAVRPEWPGSWHAFTQLALVVLIFGTSWPLLKIGIQAGATPIWFAAARACCSTLGAVALVGALGLLRWPGRRDWPIILSNGILQLSLFFALSNLALRYIPPGRSAVLAYTTTLWLVPLEALTLPLVVGAVLVLFGIVIVALATDRQRRREAGASETRLRRPSSEARGGTGR